MQPLFIFLVLLVCTLAIRIKEESWYSPFSIFALLWVFIIGFSLFTAPEYFFSSKAIGFIMLCILVYFAAGVVAERFSEEKIIHEPDPVLRNEKLLRIHFYLAFFSGCLSLFFLLLESGLKFNELLNSKRLIEVSKILTDNRYTGQRLSASTMITLMIAYSGCMTAGRFFVFSNGLWSKMKSSCILFPILLFTMIYTARAIFIYALCLFVASIIIHHVAVHRKKVLLFNRTNILILMAGVVAVPGIFLITQAVRMGITRFSADSVLAIFEHLKVWFSGNVSAFSVWIDRVDHSDKLNWGAYTFAGLNEWLGGKAREVGIYVKSYDLDGHYHFSNIYTAFRFLIDDFGFAGTLIFWFALGIFSRVLYKKILTGDLISASILSGILAWLLFSFVASAFAYNTVLFAWLLFVLIVFASEKLVPDERT